MAVPLDVIRAIHNAFRKDVEMIDKAANEAAHGLGNLDVISKRYTFFNEVLVWHADGEEKFVFPKLETVAPLLYEPYERDHRGLDSLYDRLKEALGTGDLVEIARSTSAFKFHLDIHLNKEEAHLYRVYNERVSIQEQAAINGQMSQQVPQDRFGELVPWLISLIDIDDRENITRIWRQLLPAPVFSQVIGLVRSSAGDGWAELVARVPELE